MYVIDEMTPDDIEEVSAVETRSFPSAWPISAYRRELRNRRQSFYVVLRDDPSITAITTTPRRLPEEADESGRIPFLPFLRRVKDESGIPMLYVSHVAAEVEFIADRVLRMERGRIVGIT